MARSTPRRPARPGSVVGLASLVLGCVGALACASSTPSVVPSEPEAAPRSELVESLITLGDAAFDRGDLIGAENRYERVLAIRPGTWEAQHGLAKLALRRGDVDRARRSLEGAIASDEAAVPARVALARLERDASNDARARALLEEALAKQPLDPPAHALLADLTGPAPRSPAPDRIAEARALSAAHPYDLWAPLRWLLLAQRDGDDEQAARALTAVEARLWLADLDPASAQAAISALRDAGRLRGRVVFVDVIADESVRAIEGWQMRLRALWRGQNEGLSRILEATFLPASIGAFSSDAVGGRLASIDQAARRSQPRLSPEGLIVAFTEKPPPRRARASYQRGLAELMGRRAIVRLEPGEIDSRTLGHELLHLYGAVHIRDEVDSMMNPSGDSTRLDEANLAIVRMARTRRFRGLGLRGDVAPYVDVAALTAAYENLLRVNLAFREAGLALAFEASRESRYHAAQLAREEVALDAHLGDVAMLVARLLWIEQRLPEAALLLEAAHRLYGPRSARGREARDLHDEIVRVLRARGAL